MSIYLAIDIQTLRFDAFVISLLAFNGEPTLVIDYIGVRYIKL